MSGVATEEGIEMLFDELSYQRSVWCDELDARKEDFPEVDEDSIDWHLNALVFCRAKVKHFENLILARDKVEKVEQMPTDELRLREPLREFAAHMEDVLRRNDHKGGWQNMTHHHLIFRIKDETAELVKAVRRGDNDGIMDEAADIANFAMMIYDVTIRRAEGASREGG